MPRKRINFLKALKKKFKGIPSLYKKGTKGYSIIGNPITTFRKLKKGGKMTRKKHPTLRALGTTVRARVVNGPELNVVLLGIPMLIDFGISYLTKAKAFSTKVSRPVNNDNFNYGQEEQVVLRIDRDVEVDDETSGVDVSDLDPLPQAPYSDLATFLRNQMVKAGMSEEGANLICSGAVENEELSDHLSEEDLEIFTTKIYGTMLKDEESTSELSEVA
jgi:hypothetical protein